jgi:hypothetical protein
MPSSAGCALTMQLQMSMPFWEHAIVTEQTGFLTWQSIGYKGGAESTETLSG